MRWARAITVGLPAVGAALLARGHFAEKSRLSGRRAELMRNTVDAEIMRLAGERGVPLAGRRTRCSLPIVALMLDRRAAEDLVRS